MDGYSGQHGTAPVMYQPQPGQQPVYVLQQQVSHQQPSQVPSQVPYKQNINKWTSGICDCCGDISGCCFGFWCVCCLSANVARRVNEGCCASFFCCSSLRLKMRTLYGIEGDMVKDFCIGYCCCCCMICQMDRELKHYGLVQ